MKRFTIYATLMICVAVSLAWPRRLAADSWSNPLYRYMGRWRQYHKDSKKIGIGTASLIAPKWALTAYHVAQFKDRNPHGGSAEIEWPKGTGNVLEVYHAPGQDIALIKLRTSINKIAPVALLQQSLLPSEGNIAFSLVERSGKYRRTGHATNGGDSFRVNGDPPGKAGDSGGPWVIERFGSLPDVQFAVLHGTGTAPQIGPISGWIDKIVGEGVVNWVTKSELNNGIPTDTHLWTGNGSPGNSTWNNQDNWNSGGHPGVSGALKATNHKTAQLRWISTSKKSKKNTAPKLENSWSLGRIEILGSTHHDFTVAHSKNWKATTGSGRKTILLNGADGQAFNVRDDADGAFTYTFQPGIRIKVDEDLSWNVYGDETLNIQGRVDGVGKIIKSGSGALMFANPGEPVTNNGSNGLEVLAGSVILAKQAHSSAIGGDVLINGTDAAVRLDQDEQIMDTAGLTVQEGLFDLNGKTETIGALMLVGGAVSGGTLDAGGGFQVQSGMISSNLIGAGSLTKTTTGTVTLDGDNTYTGPTTVSEGTLRVNGSIAGEVTVAGGRLDGAGTIAGNVDVLSQGGISAGNSPGELSIDGDLSILGAMLVEIGGPLQGIDYDYLDVGGIANLDGALGINLSAGFLPEPGDTFDVLSAREITLDDGFLLDQPTGLAHPFYAWTLPGGNGEILRLGYGVAVPEPATLLPAALGLLGLAWYGRRRRRRA